jgi:intermembrane space import and assembly protein 40
VKFFESYFLLFITYRSASFGIGNEMTTETLQDGKDTIVFVESELENATVSKEDVLNSETGEINWDCPCLGDLTKGPCAEPFKAAFSCFVFSNNEPKGHECLEQFRAMQECFSRYPELYAGLTGESEELQDDVRFENAQEAPPGEIVPSNEES